MCTASMEEARIPALSQARRPPPGQVTGSIPCPQPSASGGCPSPGRCSRPVSVVGAHPASTGCPLTPVGDGPGLVGGPLVAPSDPPCMGLGPVRFRIRCPRLVS